MLLSMTGFSTKSVDVPVKKGKSVTLAIDVKSVNSRFFEANCRLPSSISALEIDILSHLKQQLIRGRIYVTISVFAADASLEQVQPSLALAEDYVQALRTIAKRCDIRGEISLSDLVHLPNIFAMQRIEISARAQQAILDAVDAVAHEVVEARQREGANLEKDLQERFATCGRVMLLVKKTHEKLMREQKKRVVDATKRAQSGDQEASGIMEDLYAQLNKLDISEEITRFSSHLEASKKLLRDKQLEKGKRFDFLLQELLRETNTMAAKCSNYEISSKAVDIKVELEKAREQVQNVL